MTPKQFVRDGAKAGVSEQVDVLIVEDDPAAREATTRYLQGCGFRVVAAGGGNTALVKGRQCRPAVVVCDWRLGGEPDGVAVARALQETQGAAIVFVTAHPLEELRDATSDLLVAHYFGKPLSLPELARVIGALRGHPTKN